MNKQLLNLLACPTCLSELDLKIYEGDQEYIAHGEFTCCGCRKKFEIKDDIPFFSPLIQHDGVKNQQETYSTWWDDYHDEESIVDPTSRNFFYNSLRIKSEEMEGKIVLDAGCGNGRFSYVVSFARPQLLVAFDISSGLLHAKKAISKHNPTANVAYVQGDITRPPFKKEVFDIVFSWGVIHHTPDTKKTFKTLSKRVKERGKLGIYVYEFHPLYRFNKQLVSFIAYIRSLFLIRPLRFICSRFPAKIVRLLFLPIYYVERVLNIGVVGCHGPAGEKWDKERYFRVVIDRFKTRYASEHQLEEVLQWFQENGFNHLRVGSKPKVSVSGVKTQEETLSITVFQNEQNDESNPLCVAS